MKSSEADIAVADIVLPYSPRTHFKEFHARSQRFSVMVCHRRAGKTVACVGDITAKAFYSKKKSPRYAYVAPFYRQAKDVAWEYLKEYAAPLIDGKPLESQLRVKLKHNGAWISLYGADNPDAFRGIYLDGVVIDEYGDSRPKLWSENLLPTLADRRGWAAFIGTPKGPNHFKDVWTDAQTDGSWYKMMLKASESGILPQSELDIQRKQMTQDEYDQEYECSFDAAVIGTFFADTLRRHEDQQGYKELYNRQEPVFIAMDIGRSDAAVAWVWQERTDGIDVLTMHEQEGTDPDYWDNWFRESGYYGNIDRLWLPHDAKSKTFATKRSALEQFIDMGYKAWVVPKLSKQDLIISARTVIPICRFTARCKDGIQALLNHKRNYNVILRAFMNDAAHDWTSNISDAFKYMSVVARQGKYSEQRAKPGKPKFKPLLEPITLEGLYEARPAPTILRIS